MPKVTVQDETGVLADHVRVDLSSNRAPEQIHGLLNDVSSMAEEILWLVKPRYGLQFKAL